MAIRFGGINTGLPANLVDQLVEAERIPIKNLEVQKNKSETKLKLVEDLSGKISDVRKNLSELASTKGFTDTKIVSGDPNIISGALGEGFETGSWNIEVVEMAQKAGVMTNGFPDKDKTEVGVGYLRFQTPDGRKDVYINGGSNTLEGVSKAVNAAKVGVRATVIKDRKDPDAPFKLMLSADGYGEDNRVSYPRVYMLDGDQDMYFESENEAKNGLIKVDGFEFEIGDNTLKDIIPGVNLEIRSAAPGKNVNITVKEDFEVITGKIKKFVDAMNGVLGFIQQQNKLDKNSDTTKTLGGDGLLRSIELRLRNLIHNPQFGTKSNIQTLNQIGITFNRTGLLEYDEKKFTQTLVKDPYAVANFFSGDGFQTGFVAAIRRETSTMLDPSFGPLTNRTRGLKQKIDQFDERITQKERQVVKKEEQLRAKFARLEETMSKLKGQGGSLAAINSVNPVQNLTQTG